MSFFCLSFSHQTTPLELRERLGLISADVREASANFGTLHLPCTVTRNELVILSTCNRLELYVALTDATPSDDEREAATIRHATQAVLSSLAQMKQINYAELAKCVVCHMGSAAVRHLARVASSLESMVLGEPQILGQVENALALAKETNTLGPVLSEVFETGIRAGKRARTETHIGHNPVSIGSVAISLAESIVGPLDHKTVLIIGAGKMGKLAIETLVARGIGRIMRANRAGEVCMVSEDAEEYNTNIASALPLCDVVIAAASAKEPIITLGMVEQALRMRSDRPLVLIDIAVPRNIEHGVAGLAGVHAFNIDALQTQMDAARIERITQIPMVETIIEEEVADFAQRAAVRGIAPVITNLHQKAELIRRKELSRTLRYLPDLNEREREHVTHLSQSLVNKLLHDLTTRLRSEAGGTRALEHADAIRYLFDLDTEAGRTQTL